MPLYQAVCRQGIIVDALAPDEDRARDLLRDRLGAGKYPYLFALWRESGMRIRRKKDPVRGHLTGSRKRG